METTQDQDERFCDIVMKGGITSGIVYPPVIHKLAEVFSFKNIGGTSAGAIAAAATAAAQYGVKHSGEAKFAQLAELPKWLSAQDERAGVTHLMALFQPQPQTKAIFRVLLALLDKGASKWLRVVWFAVLGFPVAACLGMLPGLLLALLAWQQASGLLLGYALLAALLLVGLLVVPALLLALYRRAKKTLPENFYGLCSGLAPEQPGMPPPLTNWLTDLLDQLAGLPLDGRPLTFGDLWGSPDPKAERAINLEVMTTNLTHGRPYRIPFEQNIFYFHPTEFRRLFPQRVVDWLVAKAPAEAEHAPLLKLPAPADLPVIVATRMSLSFPLLLSAVPLYAIDRTRVNRADHRPERCWFSDGGICSNFPVHFFDQVLPRNPTFAVNLRSFHPDHRAEPVWMAQSNGDGQAEWWTRFDTIGSNQLFGFVGAILNVMQNWNDNTQLRLPGYRDRTVHISLDDDSEGGLNLNMPPDLIEKVTARGALAGEELLKHYAPWEELLKRYPDPKEQEALKAIITNWDNHRWVRYRSTMALIEKLLADFLQVYENPLPGERGYLDLLLRTDDQPPNSYRWETKTQRSFAEAETKALIELAKKWRALRQANKWQSFQEGRNTPSPLPELRTRPRI